MANTINKIQTEARYGALKSKKGLRMKYVKTPGGRTVVHFENKKPKSQKCSKCGAILPGTVRASACKIQHIQKSKKRPERPYGGYYCSACMRRVIISKARGGKE